MGGSSALDASSAVMRSGRKSARDDGVAGACGAGRLATGVATEVIGDVWPNYTCSDPAAPALTRFLAHAMLACLPMTRSITLCVLLLIPALAAGQARESAPRSKDAQASPTPPTVEKLGDNLYRIGNIRVDTSRSEISVPGTINRDVTTLEFIANTRGGLKAYESALSLDTDAITFNTALILIGLNRTRARNTPTAHFDPATPDGDQVEI